MAKVLIDVLLKLLTSVIDIILTPLNLLITGLFPDFGSLLSNFNSSVNTLFGGGISWFSYLLPPMTRNLVLLYLTILISYYTIYFSYFLIIKIFNIIQKLKLW